MLAPRRIWSNMVELHVSRMEVCCVDLLCGSQCIHQTRWGEYRPTPITGTGLEGLCSV